MDNSNVFQSWCSLLYFNSPEFLEAPFVCLGTYLSLTIQKGFSFENGSGGLLLKLSKNKKKLSSSGNHQCDDRSGGRMCTFLV